MDSEKIAQIADIMESRGLTRVRVEEGDGSAVELERGFAAPAAPAPAPAAPASVPAPATVPAPAAAPAPAPAEPGDEALDMAQLALHLGQLFVGRADVHKDHQFVLFPYIFDHAVDV